MAIFKIARLIGNCLVKNIWLSIEKIKKYLEI
jgi:hypothetical protein